MANAAMILTTHVLDKLREAFQSIVEGTVMATETFSDSCHGRDAKHCSQLPEVKGQLPDLLRCGKRLLPMSREGCEEIYEGLKHGKSSS